LLAIERVRELRSAAGADRLARPPIPKREPVVVHSVTIRYAFPDDGRALARLATLDSSEPPAEPVLVAEVDGELRAALSLVDGLVVADPFRPTGQLIDLLRARSRQLAASRAFAVPTGRRTAVSRVIRRQLQSRLR
jgi:hypothetical protein